MNGRMPEKIGASIIGCCFIIMNLAAGQLFSLVDHDKKLQIDYQGQELVSGETINYPTPDFLKSARIGQNTVKDAQGWTVGNIWGQKGEIKFRREVGVSPDGKEVEITFQGCVPAYEDKINANAEYAIYLDLKALDGMEWKAVTGRTWVNKSESGKIEPNMQDKPLTAQPVRMIAFSGKGKSFTLDFNPEGLGTYSDYGPTLVQGLWTVRKEGTKLKCSFSTTVRVFGATYNSKAVIYDGSLEERDMRHAFRTYEYYFELPITKQFCFGAVKAGKNFINADISAFTEKQGYGWLDAKNLTVKRYQPSGALYSSVSGEGNATFKTQLLKGLYLITLRCVAYEKESGVFSFALNNEQKAKQEKIPAETVRTYTWAQWIENGYADLRLEGKWQLSTLSFQRLMSSNEDYKIRRGFWRVAGFEPSQLYRSAHYDKPTVMPVAVDDMPLADPAKDYSQVKVELKKETLLPKYDPSAPDWRYSATLGTPGAANNGSFEDFDDIVKINRRLDEMAKDGIKVIIVNGLLSRHTFPDQLDRVRRNIALFAAEAHKRGMKVIDHVDLTLLWDYGTGFRELTKIPELLMRTVSGGLPTTGMCPVNPEYKRKFYAEHIDFIKATKIDGMMVDEVNFYSDNFCGCPHCRAKFTQDTGMVLPTDETSPELFNKDSRLWRMWLAWRMKAIGDWWVDFRREINKTKPDFVLTTYLTHYGYASNNGSLNLGMSLTESGRACDFQGTEIMSRNVMATRRSSFSYRKMKDAVKFQFDKPVYGLVYPGNDPNIAYFGWALNNMNRQVSWFFPPPVILSGVNYLDFKENMDLRNAVNYADIAILFSAQSRDWGAFNYYPEVLGTIEILTDKHIQCQFILDESITKEKLASFRVLLLTNASCLSDKQIKIIRDFIFNGGTVYLSGHAGTCDELGIFRRQWPFADILGMQPAIPLRQYRAVSISQGGAQVKPAELLNCQVVKVVDRKKAQTLGETTLSNNNKQPFIFAADYGKGKIFYCNSQLGVPLVEHEKKMNEPARWEYSQDQPLYDFYAGLLEKITGGNDFWEPVEVPGKVMVNLNSQNVSGVKSIMINLLNATGVNHKFGDMVGNKSPDPAWPPLKEDIVFNLKVNAVKEAYAVSPDFAGRKSVTFKEIKPGWWQITVPANLCRRYSIVFVNY